MRKAFLSVLVLMQPGHAFADDYPTVGSVANVAKKTAISFQCGQPNAGKIQCHFREMRLAKPTTAEIEKRITDGVASILKAPPEEFKSCDTFAESAALLKAGKPPTNAKAEEFYESWAAMPDEAKAHTIAIMEAGAKLCQDRHDASSAEAFIRLTEEEKASTCQITEWEYDREFFLNPATKKWQTTMQSADECGTIAYGEIYRADTAKDFTFWNYSTKDIVTNPSGKQWSGESCSQRDQSEHRFTWNVTTMVAECKYVELHP